MGRCLRKIFKEAGSFISAPRSYTSDCLKDFRKYLLEETSHKTGVSGMRTLTGLLTAYWRSDEWLTAWSLTAAMVGLTVAYAKSGVYVAEYGAQFVNNLLSLSPYYTAESDATLLGSALMLAGVGLATYIIEGLGHMTSTTLNRQSAKFLNREFNKAVLANRTHVHLLYCSDQSMSSVMKTPDQIDQRIEEAPSRAMGGAIGLGIGAMRVLFSFAFIGQALLSKSAPVDALPFLGTYGTAALAFGAAVAYVPANMFLAYKMGKILEKLMTKRQQVSAAYRGEWNAFTRRYVQVASADGEKIQQKIFNNLYDRVDNIWHKENMADSGYMVFKHLYNFLENKIVSYLPAAPALASGSILIKDYLAASEMVSRFLTDCSWVINVMPGIANVKSYSSRLTEIAEAAEKVQNAKEWYAQSGVAETNIYTHDGEDIVLENLDIMMPGKQEAFLKVGNMRFKAGEWVAIQGSNGSGKSTLMKMVNGLWPYGRGNIYLPENSKKIYACQDVRLERTTLKQIVCVPDDEQEYDDATVAEVLQLAGLEKFAGNLHDEFFGVKRWEENLSGGEKQKLRLAQILLHKPDIICLDEATSAMDSDAKIKFHKLIKEHCPQAIVLSIVHDEKLLGISPDATEKFYDRYLWVDKGRIEQRDTPYFMMPPSRFLPPGFKPE